MKKIDLGQTITILANIGVIAGIVFLAVEIQQNNELLASQARNERIDARKDLYRMTLADPELRSVVRENANGQLGQASPDEQHMLGNFFAIYLIDWEFLWAEYESGSLTFDDMTVDAKKRYLYETPGMLEWWQEYSWRFHPDFVAWMNANVLDR